VCVTNTSVSEGIAAHGEEARVWGSAYPKPHRPPVMAGDKGEAKTRIRRPSRRVKVRYSWFR